MHLLLLLLLTAAVKGSALSRRQRGKVDPGTASDCTAWDDVDSSSKNWCQYFLSEWGLSRDDFLSWVCAPTPFPLSTIPSPPH